MIATRGTREEIDFTEVWEEREDRINENLCDSV
jgi:hypothetical protein